MPNLRRRLPVIFLRFALNPLALPLSVPLASIIASAVSSRTVACALIDSVHLRIVQLYQNDVCPDLYDGAPRDDDIGAAPEETEKFPRTRDNDRFDTTRA